MWREPEDRVGKAIGLEYTGQAVDFLKRRYSEQGHYTQVWSRSAILGLLSAGCYTDINTVDYLQLLYTVSIFFQLHFEESQFKEAIERNIP